MVIALLFFQLPVIEMQPIWLEPKAIYLSKMLLNATFLNVNIMGEALGLIAYL